MTLDAEIRPCFAICTPIDVTTNDVRAGLITDHWRIRLMPSSWETRTAFLKSESSVVMKGSGVLLKRVTTKLILNVSGTLWSIRMSWSDLPGDNTVPSMVTHSSCLVFVTIRDDFADRKIYVQCNEIGGQPAWYISYRSSAFLDDREAPDDVYHTSTLVQVLVVVDPCWWHHPFTNRVKAECIQGCNYDTQCPLAERCYKSQCVPKTCTENLVTI